MRYLKIIFSLLFISAILFNCVKETDLLTQQDTSGTTAVIVDNEDIEGDLIIDQIKRETEIYLTKVESDRFTSWEIMMMFFTDVSSFFANAVSPSIRSAHNQVLDAVDASAGYAGDLDVTDPVLMGDATFIANEFDNAGIRHIDVLHEALTGSRELVFDEDGLNTASYRDFAVDYSIANYGFTLADFESFTPESIDAQNASVPLPETDSPMVNLVAVLYSEGALTATENAIMNLYFEALENISTFEDFYDYSVGVETAIIASDYPDETKCLLLSTMATARHDANYWLNNL